VHDHLFRFGVPPTVQGEPRARRRRRWHPDFDGGDAPADLSPPEADVAVDFVDATLVVDRMHAAFFRIRT
jgi:hypothetical protein